MCVCIENNFAENQKILIEVFGTNKSYGIDYFIWVADFRCICILQCVISFSTLRFMYIRGRVRWNLAVDNLRVKQVHILSADKLIYLRNPSNHHMSKFTFVQALLNLDIIEIYYDYVVIFDAKTSTGFKIFNVWLIEFWGFVTWHIFSKTSNGSISIWKYVIDFIIDHYIDTQIHYVDYLNGLFYLISIWLSINLFG